MTTASRRTQSGCYSLSIRCFQPAADSPVFPSPLQPTLKSKFQLNTRIPSNLENDFASSNIIKEKYDTKPSTQVLKKRVKINCANPLPGQSISRRPGKSPSSQKLLQTMTLERTGTRAKPFMVTRLSSLNEDNNIDPRIFHAPMSCKVSTKKLKPGRKNSEAFLKPRTMLLNTGTLPPKVLDLTINGGSNTLDLTSTGPGSLEDLGSNDQSLVYQNVDKAEDFNRRLREIFQGTGVMENNHQGSEFDMSISEEKADFTLKVFSTKKLLKSCLKREEITLYAK